MTERVFDTARAAATQIVRKLGHGSGSGPNGRLNIDDLQPLLQALGVQYDDGPPPRPNTYIKVHGAYAWWVDPVGETDPDKADVWSAALVADDDIDPGTALMIEDVENWEGFPWEGRAPTDAELRALKAQVIGALGFLSAGAPNAPDPLIDAAEKIRAHVTALRAEMGQRDSFTQGDNSDRAYEGSTRGGLGGLSGDFAAAFHPGVVLALANLLTAIAAGSPAGSIQAAADTLGYLYLNARTRDDERF